MIITGCRIANGTWWERALTYRINGGPTLTVLRVVLMLTAVVVVYFATDPHWKGIGRDRRLVLGLVALLTLLQEGDQLALHATMLVWRLPILMLLNAACLSIIRKYINGKYVS